MGELIGIPEGPWWPEAGPQWGNWGGGGEVIIFEDFFASAAESIGLAVQAFVAAFAVL